jgi:hypothetical protein
MTKKLQKIRVYTRSSPVFFCMNCPSCARIKDVPIPPLRLRCMEFPDEIKEINIPKLFGESAQKTDFPEFCPLKQKSRKSFEKERGW